MPKSRSPRYRDADFARIHNKHLHRNHYTLAELVEAYRADPRYKDWSDDQVFSAVLELAALFNRLGVREWRQKKQAWEYCIYLGDISLVDYLHITDPHNPTPLQARAHEVFDDTELQARIRGTAGVRKAQSWIAKDAAPCVTVYRRPEPVIQEDEVSEVFALPCPLEDAGEVAASSYPAL